MIGIVASLPQISQFYDGTENHVSWGDSEAIRVIYIGIYALNASQSESHESDKVSAIYCRSVRATLVNWFAWAVIDALA